MMDEKGFRPLDRYVPEIGWGYSVIQRTWDRHNRYEVCAFYDGEIAKRMDVFMCRDLMAVGRALQYIMHDLGGSRIVSEEE